MRQAVSIAILVASIFCLNSPSWSDDSPSTVPAAPGPETAAEAAPVTQDVPQPTPRPVYVPDLSGDWCGSWLSCSNGHKGPMKASFCRLCNGNYRVTFVGKFCKVIPFRYTTTLNVTGYKDGLVYLSGSHYLGPVLGTFTYNAWASDRQFASGYGSKLDQGQFCLAR